MSAFLIRNYTDDVDNVDDNDAHFPVGHERVAFQSARDEKPRAADFCGGRFVVRAASRRISAFFSPGRN